MIAYSVSMFVKIDMTNIIMLTKLKAKIINKSQQNELLRALNALPQVWLRITGEEETMDIEDSGVFSPANRERAIVLNTTFTNNVIDFTFNFVVGEKEGEHAEFNVPMKAIHNQEIIIFSVGDNFIEMNNSNWMHEIVKAIITQAENNSSL